MFNNYMYHTKFHNCDLSQFSFLITGGAGFIGSNIVEYLLKYNAGHVRVLDNLSNGYYENIQQFEKLPNFEFIEGDIRDIVVCKEAVKDINFILHQAALGSVPRSIEDPIISNSVNVSGFLNMLVAARDSPALVRMIYAASSSTYGDSPILPKKEGFEGNPLSPYAVTKLVNELYAEVFARVYNFNTVGLRYFNVFGPKQNPNNPYAAVIPIFCKNFIRGDAPKINGNGSISRDFTFVENVVQANILSLFCESTNHASSHEIYNVACGVEISLDEVIGSLRKISKKDLYPAFSQSRIGDIKHSRANIDKISSIGYLPLINFEEGIKITYRYYLDQSI